MNPRTSHSLLLAFSLVFLVGCDHVPNDAGDIPPGEWVDYEFRGLSDELSCGSFSDSAFLIEDEADIEHAMSQCDFGAPALAEELRASLAEAAEYGQVLVFLTVAYGGCVRGHDLPVLALDGDTLRPWLIKDTSAYGRADAACTADLGEQLDLLTIEATMGAGTVELTVGEWNSDLPSSPYEEHGLYPQ